MSNLSRIKNDADEQLAPFLRNLADSIDSSSLTSTQIQHISEFYMSYKVCNENNNNGDLEDPKDLMRFFTLGLYIYKFILNDNSQDTD